MSFVTVKKLVDIVDWFIKKYENTKQWFKKKYRGHRSRKIRGAVDSHNTRTVDDVVSDVKQRRKDRHDAS